MLLCAVVGLLLVLVGASALPRPADVSQALEPAAQVAVTTPTTPAPTGVGSSTPPTSSPESSAEAAGLIVPEEGPRTYATSSLAVPSTTDRGRLYRFDVRVEKGLDLDADDVARALETTLDDPRSWRSTGRVRFSLVAAGQSADLHAYLVTPGTVDRLCAPLLTRGEVSCQAGNKVVLNAKRWVFGADAYGSSTEDVAGYREYLVNHEFGHALGRQHVGCPRAGRPAPVMLQQTKGLQGCTANPWPSVTGG